MSSTPPALSTLCSVIFAQFKYIAGLKQVNAVQLCVCPAPGTPPLFGSLCEIFPVGTVAHSTLGGQN